MDFGLLSGLDYLSCANPTVSTRPTRSPEPSEPIGLRMVNGYDMSKPDVVGYAWGHAAHPHLRVREIVTGKVGFARAQRWLMTLARYLFFDDEIESYCRGRDLQRPWMLRRQRVWGLLKYRAFIISPDLGVDLSKLLLVESPKTRIAWHLMPWTIRFDFLAGCSYENLVSSLLPFRTSPAAAVLAIYWTVIKPCVGFVL
uniref:Uncharacterized protein n=1 Tax=Fagus sylvatica TaxID=28930 RepID=A0A2N9F1S1_FAGSY